MTSYMYNPSQKVTDLLSKFFVFDPSELELGIWSGDLQLKHVQLKKETLHPLLNRKANKPHTNPLKKAPLHMKLLRGTVGNLRIRIPWKRLVWGQGAVQLECSDVEIVLSYQSREETEEQRKQGLIKERKKKKKKKDKTSSSSSGDDEDEDETTQMLVSQAYRDAKQKRLQEVERRHLQGVPVATYLDTMHRKNSIARDVRKAEEAAAAAAKGGRKGRSSSSGISNHPNNASSAKKTPGRLDKWIKKFGSDFFWRFFSGVQGSITKARIVIMQDGVEVGCIIQSIEVVAGKDGMQFKVNNMDTRNDSEGAEHGGDNSYSQKDAATNEEVLTAEGLTPPEPVAYESAYEDGEHVDKTIKQHGFGLFVRKEVNMSKIPKALRFSNSVSADDYILRPVDLEIAFSFFFPFPPERRKKRSLDSQSHTTPTTTASTSAAASVGESTTTSAKSRRGKREKEGGKLGRTAPESRSLARSSSLNANATGKHGGNGGHHRTPMSTDSRLRAQQRRLGLDPPVTSMKQRPGFHRKVSMRSLRSGINSVRTGPLDFMTAAQESVTGAVAWHNRSVPSDVLVPKLDCRVTLKEIRLVFTTRHYELMNYFLSTVSRMKNGKPDEMIRSTPKETNTALFQRKFMNMTPNTASVGMANSAKSTAQTSNAVGLHASTISSSIPDDKKENTSIRETPTAHMLRAMLAPITGFAGTTTHDLDDEDLSPREGATNSIQKSIRAQAITKWWKYSIGAILWELKKKKHLASNFREMYISFDWNRQRYKRKEYIELYIAKIAAGNKGQSSLWVSENSEKKDAELLRIEDELPLEQILLYRSIARSMRVRGVEKMPDSIVELHSGQTLLVHEKAKKRPLKGSADKDFDELGEDTLLSMVQRKFAVAEELRTENGLVYKFEQKMNPARRSSSLLSNLDDGNDSQAVEGNSSSGRPSMRKSLSTSNLETSSHTTNSGSRTNVGGNTNLRRKTPRKFQRRNSFGYDNSDIQTGNFYSSAVGRRDADGRTIRTFQKKDSKLSRTGQTLQGGADERLGKKDDRMKISCSLSVNLIEIIVVKEEYTFDLTHDNLQKGRNQPGSVVSLTSRKDDFLENDSSSDEVSDLSVLTDDARFFKESESDDQIVHEEEVDEGAEKLSSTDFLLFGLPEEPLLRISIKSLGCSVRGRSGGRLNLGVSIRSMSVVSETLHILTIGSSDASVLASSPMPTRRKSIDSLEMDLSSHALSTSGEYGASRLNASKGSNRALKFFLCIDQGFKDVQCDFAKILLTLDLSPVSKLLDFYSKSEIKFPDRIVEKSSQDVARKFMVYKTSSSQDSGELNLAFRIQGVTIRIPIESDESAYKEDSDVDESHKYENSSVMLEDDSRPKSAFVISTGSIDLFSGSYVEDVANHENASDFAASKNSLFSASVATGRSGNPAKAFEMLNVIELIEANDSFSCKNAVTSIENIQCNFETRSGMLVKILETPIDIESLVTMNETSLLETALPKTQVIVEVSHVNILMSKNRIQLLSAMQTSMDFKNLDTSSSTALTRRLRKPDPPRIEILAPRILHSIDLNCSHLRFTLIRDLEYDETEVLTQDLKDAVMQESLTDFLSLVSCFDFNFPNEEAISSAMQVCIGRLVGLGLSDDEAWGCTNTARLNFMDDIALMRRAQTEAVEQLSASMGKDLNIIKEDLQAGTRNESASERESDESSSNNDDDDSIEISLSETSYDDAFRGPSIELPDPDVNSEDDGSAHSVEIVETTVMNAVEKTMVVFAPLLKGYMRDFKGFYTNTIITLEMPLGFKLSTVKLFYDAHVTLSVTSLVATNAAGIELLTLVPESRSTSDELSLDKIEGASNDSALSFSRFDLDHEYGFGLGGLPISALAMDDEEAGFISRKRSRYDDVDLGELECLFCSKVYEHIIDDIADLQKRSTEEEHSHQNIEEARQDTSASFVLTIQSMSALFTSDELTPFSRISLEKMAFRNERALANLNLNEIPTWMIVSKAASIENLSPEGQFYPDTLSVIAPVEQDSLFTFQINYFKSRNSWKESSRLVIGFNGYRLFLVRQYIHELLQFFVYDRDGVGRLKKKYSVDVVDRFGNQKPPLLWSVRVENTSVVCPRSSRDSDMAAFEVGEADIAVSYIPESFEMPTESKPFVSNPRGKSGTSKSFEDNGRRSSFLSTSSDYHECLEEELGDDTRQDEDPISAYEKDLKKRIKIVLNKVRIFTVLAQNSIERDAVESPLFRFSYNLDGHAEDGKLVYEKRKNSNDSSASLGDIEAAGRFKKKWEEISCGLLNVEVFFDSAPHTRLFIGSRQNKFALDARLSQLALLLSIWDDNMQEQPAIFPFPISQVNDSAAPPDIPKSFPDYGTEEYVQYLEDISSVRSEICCIFKFISLKCTYDSPGFFLKDPGCFKFFEDPGCPEDLKPAVILTLEDAVIHIVNDFLNVRRIAIGTSFLEIIDERRHGPFQKVLSTTRNDENDDSKQTWADLSWGLRTDVRTLSSTLPMPVIFTVFMTPGWSLINVGAQSLNGIMHDLSWIWVFLDYFKSYYTEAAFGNAGHTAQRWAHRVKTALRKSKGAEIVNFEPFPGVNVDFRLWICKPILSVPCDYQTSNTSSLCIDSCSGLRYRYKSIQSLSSQEISTTNLNLHFLNEFQAPHLYRRSGIRDKTGASRSLVEGLSFGLRYDCNNLCNHKDVSLQIPFAGDDVPDLSVAGPELEVTPVILPTAVICRPVGSGRRLTGPHVCEITCIIEVLPTTVKAMTNFFKGPEEVNEDFNEPDEDNGPVTFTVAAQVGDVRIFAIDPVLGVQLPVAVATIGNLWLCASRLEGKQTRLNLEGTECPPEDLHLTARSSIWIDYFKLGMTRSWEPLLEPLTILLTHENSRQRGKGWSLDFETPVQVNLCGAFLQIIEDTVDSFSNLIRETFAEKSNLMRNSSSLGLSSRDRSGVYLQDRVATCEGNVLKVMHEIPKSLKNEDRVAFSMKNLTGQRVRIHQQSDHSFENCEDVPTVVSYLNHSQTMGLTFAATISVIKNLSVVEVPYPGLPGSLSGNDQTSLRHAVDLQIPGFRWIQGIKVDTFGRRFECLVPRSLKVQEKLLGDWRLKNAMTLLTEIGLDSGGRLITVRSLFEVCNNTTHPIKLVFNPDPRQRPFENTKDCHAPDVIQDGDTAIGTSNTAQSFLVGEEEIELIQPGASFQIPILLLERSLQMTGSHLGCFWICPDTSNRTMPFWNFFRSSTNATESNDLEASFSSRPIQLAKLIHESSVLFQNGNGEDVSVEEATTGVQVSCPTRSERGGERVPFCYALEVERSPLVSARKDVQPDAIVKESVQIERKKPFKKKVSMEERTHAPVAYSISVHAPLVIVNLLPEGGRFELMHAVRKKVVWYADLNPGQQVPVHSVGLDSPLLLSINLGFCRTPVGEGALVHHGADTFVAKRGEPGPRFKSIGKAALKGTKQIGKTLTAISDSPDKRAQGRLAKIKAPKIYAREQMNTNKGRTTKKTLSDGNSLGLENETNDLRGSGGKVHSVESIAFSQEEIATETTVVDGVGQRLTLNLDNVRGGGGQRRISLFCPYWIVNTTEHALRYKQDKGKSFVSGTVNNPKFDGSRPVDGSKRNYRNQYQKQATRRKMSKKQVTMAGDADESKARLNKKTIFPGTPGALATSPGSCELSLDQVAGLIDKEMALEELAGLAFMFNFHEEGISIGQHMLSVQLHDGSGEVDYSSDWSRGFSLDSVGFAQTIAMNTREGRAIELSAEVSVAPGFLASYTKIIRLVPKYVVLNRLDFPVRIWQDSSVFRPSSQEQSTGITEATELNKDTRKWRYHYEEKHSSEKINQYEGLFGRPSTIDDSWIIDNSIPEGTTAHRSALYIKSVGTLQVSPFLLPDTRAERQLRLDLGGIWKMSPSFSADIPGEHTLKISRATDLRMLKHVSTRAAPKYQIVLPPPENAGIGEWDGELGVFFETDWGAEKRIIVKGTKRGHFAFNHTDIHVGDELLSIDGVPVAQLTFAEAMKLIKEKMTLIRSEFERIATFESDGDTRQGVLSRIGPKRRRSVVNQPSHESKIVPQSKLILTFRTLEERLRKIRAKADNKSSVSRNKQNARESEFDDLSREKTVNVEMKALHNTMFVILREPDSINPPFRIQNRSINHVVFYRQRGCEGHPWKFLMPGESMPYTWEEPMRSKKLVVRVAAKIQDVFKVNNQDLSFGEKSLDIESDKSAGAFTSSEEIKKATRVARLKQSLAYQYVNTEEQGGFGPTTIVRLEEIGFRTFLPVSSSETGHRGSGRPLNCEIDTDGGTRLLIVSDVSAYSDDRNVLKDHLKTLKKQISYEEQRMAGLKSLDFLMSREMEKRSVAGDEEKAERIGVIENDARRFMEDFSEDTIITDRHRIIVEVIEAVGLNSSDFIGNCSPYCEVFLKGRSKSRKHIFQKRKNKRKTYFVEKSLNPKWTDQIFVFNTPEDAVRVTRGHQLLIKVRNFKVLGQHPILGQAVVHFGSIRNQQELVGWYPLAGRAGRSDLDSVHRSDVSRGSVKLRVQWIYTPSALIHYFLVLSEARLLQLSSSHDGMNEQLTHAIEADERRKQEEKSVNAAGKITKLSKFEKRMERKRQTTSKNDTRRRGSVDDKATQGIINSSLNLLKGTLRASREKYLQSLYFQTTESRLNRQLENGNFDGSIGDSTKMSDPRNGSAVLSSGSATGSNDGTGSDPENKAKTQGHPPSPTGSNFKNNKSLDDFFASSRRSPYTRSPYLTKKGRFRLDSGDSPRRRARFKSIDDENAKVISSYRRLSLDIEHLGEDDSADVDLLRAVMDSVNAASANNFGVSDVLSINTDVDSESKKKRDIQILLNLGFAFHRYGSFFHYRHLPHHFRGALFSGFSEGRGAHRLHRRKFAVGGPKEILCFNSAQSANALYNDPDLEVIAGKKSFVVRLKSKQVEELPSLSKDFKTKEIIHSKLRVPDVAPIETRQRSEGRVEKFFVSRCRFERYSRRNLGSILNPGGWLIVRPITALNLPDGYTGMTVKAKYGSESVSSRTVDAKVTPRWGSLDDKNSVKDLSSDENDLRVLIEPQQTSGVIKLSVTAEKMNNKIELGVLEIPLGAAVAACLDSGDDEIDQSFSSLTNEPFVYVRWYALMEPKLSVPFEGSLGATSRSIETEKTQDSMFSNYFTPCIQLAMIWSPKNTPAKNGKKSSSSDAMKDRDSISSPRVESYINADLTRMSVALVDSERARELLSFTAMDLDIRYSVTKTKTRTGLIVGWIQLDHQDARAREPVVLAPTPTATMLPTLQFLSLKDNLRTKSNIVSYEYIGVAVREFDLTVEEAWLFELWEFFMRVVRHGKAKRNSDQGQQTEDFLLQTDNCFVASALESSDTESLISILEMEADARSKSKLYIEQLILGLVKVNLSYVKGKSRSFEVVDKGAKTLKSFETGELAVIAQTATGALKGVTKSQGDQSETFLKWSQRTHNENIDDPGGNNLPGILAAIFPSVSDAPIRLQGKVIDHAFESSTEILSSIKSFYITETLKQIYRIIGSLDFVGNPTILFSSFVSGVRDLVAAPTNAFLKSPTNVNQVGIAVGKGTLSLFSHSASGLFGFAAKMSATAGQAAAVLSLDTEYSQWHRDTVVNEATNLNRVWKRRGIQSLPEMIGRPIGDVVVGVAMGASGLIVSPYKGFKRGGGAGLIKGVAVGTAGVVAKPLVGVLDALTHFNATCHDVAKSVNVLERRYQPAVKIRLPSVFGPMKILVPYNPNFARSVQLLNIFPPKIKRNRRKKRGDEIFVHSEILLMEPGVDTFAIVTTIRVVLIRLKKDSNGNLTPAIGWEVLIGNDATVASRLSDHGHNGVALTITRREAAVLKDNEMKESKSRRSKRIYEAIRTPTFSSALSYDSRLSGFLSEDGDDEDEPELNNDNFAESRSVDASGEVEIEVDDEVDPNLDHGATKKGDEVVKWYTMLAEYQHRPQLTRLHNAVSSLVGNFDSIISDPQSHLSEGVTKFGIYTFAKPSNHPASKFSADVEVALALERLPWMHEDVITKGGKYDVHQQEVFVQSIRQNWTLATDLEGSKKEGGPSWLVEARARAMHNAITLPTTSVLPDLLDPNDPVIREINVNRQKQKNPHGTAPTKFPFSEQWSDSDDEESLAEASMSIGVLTADSSEKGVSNKKDTSSKPSNQYQENEDDLFHSLKLHDIQGDELVDPENADRRTSQSEEQETKGSQSGISGSHTNANQSSEDTPLPAVLDLKKSINEKIEGKHDHDFNDGKSVEGAPRIERVESLVEKLVIINAQQIQRQSNAIDDDHSFASSRMASVIQQEVADLRSQVEARAAEDEALRSEIRLLREQLSERREQRSAKRTGRSKMMKVPEVLRFGQKKEDNYSNDNGQKGDGTFKAAKQGSTYEIGLNDTVDTPKVQDPARSTASMTNRRLSSGSGSFSSALRQLETSSTSTPVASQTAGGDASGVARRSRAGETMDVLGEVRPSARRTSLSHVKQVEK